MKYGSNNITCVGYNNMESRMATTASYLFGGNVSNFLLSMVNKTSKLWEVNLEDPAVRSICVAIGGEALPPYVPPASATPAAPKKEEKQVQVKTPEDIRKEYLNSALFTTAGTSTALGLASLVPNSPMMTTFALSCWVGKCTNSGIFLFSFKNKILNLSSSFVGHALQEIVVCRV